MSATGSGRDQSLFSAPSTMRYVAPCAGSFPIAYCPSPKRGRTRALSRDLFCRRWATWVCSGCVFPRNMGGAALDPLASVVLAEELGRSTFVGFAITVLVHTDMATPHLLHAGTPEQVRRYLPDLIAGRKIAAVAMTEADAGSDLASMRTKARWRALVHRRLENVHHQQRAGGRFLWPPKPEAPAVAATFQYSSSRRVGLDFPCHVRSRKPAGFRATPPGCHLTIAGFHTQTCCGSRRTGLLRAGEIAPRWNGA